jgi:transposase
MRIRKVKNSVGNIVIQVGYYQGKRFQLIKHMGSAKNQIEEVGLVKQASDFINKQQLSLLSSPALFDQKDLIPLGYSRNSAYHFFAGAFDSVFPEIKNKIIKDLVIIRIIHPASKIESVHLLHEYFGIKYSKSTVHRAFLKADKQVFVNQLVTYARQQLSFDFSLLFYDVTTLYFESMADEDLKVPGFSKDGKHTQPQILIGLVVDQHGFPIFYQIFKGNTFEGHTMLPIILEFKSTFQVKQLTIVADSAMLSEDNLSTLEDHNLTYIVGNKTIGTYRDTLAKKIKKLKQKDNATCVVVQGQRRIIYHYSAKRGKKDLYEIEKAITKAEYLARNPSKRSKAKYLKVQAEKLKVNQELIDKHKFLAGIKSYKTNSKLPSSLVIERYGDLWKIEKSFRMTKHDLKARPIFHRKEEAIQAHILIVFAANAVARHVELQTHKSISQVVKELMRIIDVKFKLKNLNKIFTLTLPPH